MYPPIIQMLFVQSIVCTLCINASLAKLVPYCTMYMFILWTSVTYMSVGGDMIGIQVFQYYCTTKEEYCIAATILMLIKLSISYHNETITVMIVSYCDAHLGLSGCYISIVD